MGSDDDLQKTILDIEALLKEKSALERKVLQAEKQLEVQSGIFESKLKAQESMWSDALVVILEHCTGVVRGAAEKHAKFRAAACSEIELLGRELGESWEQSRSTYAALQDAHEEILMRSNVAAEEVASFQTKEAVLHAELLEARRQNDALQEELLVAISSNSVSPPQQVSEYQRFETSFSCIAFLLN